MRYQCSNCLEMSKNFAELIWKVTGTDGGLEIKRNRVIVKLDPGIKFLETGCYTGFKGSKATNCYITQSNSQIVFDASQKLFPGEGFTVVIKMYHNFLRGSGAVEYQNSSFWSLTTPDFWIRGISIL